jgi:hypothetical protein
MEVDGGGGGGGERKLGVSGFTFHPIVQIFRSAYCFQFTSTDFQCISACSN